MARRMQKRRLLKLAAYLEALPEQYKKPVSRRKRLPGFNMNSWLDNAHSTMEFDGQPMCGTAACAAGHAATMPEFRKLGLRLKKSESEIDGRLYGNICYGRLRDFNALEVFFGLNGDQSDVFVPEGNNRNDPVLVAEQLRHLVKTGKLLRSG